MARKIIIFALCGAVLAACGDNYYERAGTGGLAGAGTAALMLGNPIVGLGVGAATGAVTTRDNIDLGPGPTELFGGWGY